MLRNWSRKSLAAAAPFQSRGAWAMSRAGLLVDTEVLRGMSFKHGD